MASVAEKGISLVNKIDTKVLLIGGVVVIGAIAAYELLKGKNTSVSPSQSSSTPATGTSNTNPSLTSNPYTAQAGSTSSTTPNFTLPQSSSSSTRSTPNVSGSYNYVITSTYAPYNYTSTTSTYAPVTSSTTTNNTSTTSTYAPQITSSNTQTTSTSTNTQNTYTTGGIGSGLNVGSTVSSGLLSWLK